MSTQVFFFDAQVADWHGIVPSLPAGSLWFAWQPVDKASRDRTLAVSVVSPPS